MYAGFIARTDAEFVARMVQFHRETEAIEARYMTNAPTDWHQALARVSGQLVRGEQRVTTQELLTVHLGVPVTDRACRRLRRVMRELGWRGPRLMRWGKKTIHGYWRHPTIGLPPARAACHPTQSSGQVARSRPADASRSMG